MLLGDTITSSKAFSRRSLLALVAVGGAGLLSACAGGRSDGASSSSATSSDTSSGNAEALPEPQPTTVSGLSPATGSLVGGTTVTISGTNLAGVTSATIGGISVLVAAVNGTSATFVTPAALNFASASAPVALTLSDSTVVTDAGAFAYDALSPVDRQMQYMFRYWQQYNLDEWGQFPDNDCGNFVNQALVQRGWVQNDDWYSDYATTGAYNFSWIRGNAMDDYFASRDDTTRISFEDRAKVKIGDVVMFDWDAQNDNGVDHTMTVSGVGTKTDGTPVIKLVGHTVDAQYRDFDTAITVDNPGGTAHFWSIA